MGGHVLVECMSSGCIDMLCFAEGHVLLEGMFFLRVCITGGHVL